MLVELVPIAKRALAAALAGIPFTIETLMTIAAVGAVIINASEEAAAVVFLFLVGELLEGIAAGRARASIQSLTKLVPKTALMRRTARTAKSRPMRWQSVPSSSSGPAIESPPTAPSSTARARSMKRPSRARAFPSGKKRTTVSSQGRSTVKRCSKIKSPPRPPTTRSRAW